MKLKNKLKSIFKTKDTSEYAVEFVRMWLQPFADLWDATAPIDKVVNTFFATEDRKFFHGNAKRSFKMPGQVFLAGNRPVPRFGAREVAKGQHMLIAADKKEGTARVEIELNGKERTFLLQRHELELLKDWVELKEC